MNEKSIYYYYLRKLSSVYIGNLMESLSAAFVGLELEVDDELPVVSPPSSSRIRLSGEFVQLE